LKSLRWWPTNFPTALLNVIAKHCVNLTALSMVFCKRDNSNTKPTVTKLESCSHYAFKTAL
jgi:hypothetical protein